jgi:membrane protein implicated in regulation of membrane protease activity
MTTAEARERAQMILGAISLLLWFGVAYGLAVTWYLQTHTQRTILFAGFAALVIAAVPWLGYRWLVRRLTTTRRRETL